MRQNGVSLNGVSLNGVSLNGVSLNGVSLNGISENGVSLNGVSLNGVSLNGVSLNGVSLNGVSLNGATNTELGRQFLAYFSYCALGPDETLTAQDDNGESYEFTGRLGLVPEWRDRPLTDNEKNWVSACLIAHVNAIGASVEISVRSESKLAASPQEIRAFGVYEGTFFGRLHTADTSLYSCIGDDANVALANATDRAQRICTDDTDECEIVSLGRCRDICDTRDADYGWTDCWANGERFSETLSVYLRSTDADGANRTCEGDDCTMKIRNGKAGILDCDDAGECKSVCKNDSVCAIDATAADEFRAVVKDDSLADINCHEANECSVKARSNSSVDIDCKDANDCSDVVCKAGAECLLDCTGAVDCGFDVCRGELTYLPRRHRCLRPRLPVVLVGGSLEAIFVRPVSGTNALKIELSGSASLKPGGDATPHGRTDIPCARQLLTWRSVTRRGILPMPRSCCVRSRPAE